MTSQSRRGFLAAAGSAVVLSACSQDINYSERGSATGAIDERVDRTLSYLHTNYPDTLKVADASVGQLVMPLVTKAGFMVGAGYGRGALLRDGQTLGYFSATSGSLGWQIGAQQYSHVLYFMNEPAYSDFLQSNGWTADAEVNVTVAAAGGNLSGAQINNSDVIAYVFGQAGLHAGATMNGTKYTRIYPGAGRTT